MPEITNEPCTCDGAVANGICNNTTVETKRGEIRMTVEPCKKCLENAKEEGDQEGYDRGHSEGVEEGREEGLEEGSIE